ncbi:DUF4192 domain-containing protein [Dactylosporangium sp. NPDC051484]|uniref:DUF4192 domain-containing protein n=1 Tax=Dactylosporangium sp. NPDC051484 TaxID=3154942 RepID=UPI00344E6DA3
MASRMRLRGPAELLSAMPYLMGFHPSDSLVALGLRGSGLHLQLRGDLPDDGDAGAVLAEHYAHLFRSNGIDGALLIGYGPPGRAEPFLRAVGAALAGCGIVILDMLRTHDGRYWSLLCDAPGCCPPEGRPFDPETSIVAAEATLAGLVALPDRDAVAARFAGPTGPALAAMEEAGNRANLRVLRLVTGRDAAGVRAAVVGAGRAALEAALARYAAGRRLTDDEVAWLQVLLHVVAFRDRVWERLDRDVRRGGAGAEHHRLLWTDLVRRCEPCSVAPAATLLSYLSWRDGNGLHASIALDRALDADPDYSAAGLMAEILGRGLSPAQVPAISRDRRRRPPGRPRRSAARPGRGTLPTRPGRAAPDRREAPGPDAGPATGPVGDCGPGNAGERLNGPERGGPSGGGGRAGQPGHPGRDARRSRR